MAKEQYVTFAWLLKSRIIEFIYGKPFASLHLRLTKIAEDNCNMQSGSHPSFVYKDEFYNPNKTVPGVAKLRLLGKFKPMMAELLQEKADLEAEQQVIIAYVLQTLNMSRSVNDYFRLFPETLHDILRQAAPEQQSFMLNRVTDEQVEQYKKENQQFFEIIRNRLTINLIT